MLLGTTLLATPMPGTAQEETAPAATVERSAILSSEISVSQDAAGLELELADGRLISLVLDADRTVRLNGERIGAYERRDALDEAWRDLLQRAMDTPTAALADLLVDWSPPEAAAGLGGRLDRELEAVITAAPAPAAPAQDPPAAAGDASDSIQRLNERIREMERLLDEPSRLRDEIRSELRTELRDELRGDWRGGWRSPWRNIAGGLQGVFSTLMTYAILVGLGFIAVFFGRRQLERIADTARHHTLRSGLVGLAGSFLVLPAYILGLLALAVSIVGIPLILVFAPLFPVAVVLAALTGYLAVAHGAGEALAERRFTGGDWFSRANSYYYVMTGVGLLLVLFIAAHIVSMAGPWLDFAEGLLVFVGATVTWAAFTVGLGAVLITRGGSRPADGDSPPAAGETDG